MHLQFCRDGNSVKQEQTGTAVLSTVCEWILEQLGDVFAYSELPITMFWSILKRARLCFVPVLFSD